jgi:hypothetical protein
MSVYINYSLGCKGVIPALGLAWSSMVTVRLMLSRTEQFIDVRAIKVKNWNVCNRPNWLTCAMYVSIQFKSFGK